MKRTPKAGGSLVEGNRRPSTSREALSPAQESPDQSRASIGLHRHEVKVVDHDPHWEVLYQAECERLREAVGSCVLDIQHVGSTAVPGLPAKPIIDIALGLQRLEDGYDLVPRLAAVGYQFMSEFDIPGELFFRRPEGDYHLHVLEMGSLYWTNYLLFRDYLSSDPEIAIQYSKLKKNLAARFEDDRAGYTRGKAEFIEDMLNEARRRAKLPPAALRPAKIPGSNR